MNDRNYISQYLMNQNGSHQGSQQYDIHQHHPQLQQHYLPYQAPSDLSEYGSVISSNTTITNTGNKSKRKSESEDSKGKKRFVWPEALHKDFVAAVFDVGLRSASPKAILDLLPRSDNLTTEHIKSHLQKFRVHRERSREDFLTHYEMSVQTGRLSLNPNITIPRNPNKLPFNSETSSNHEVTRNINEDHDNKDMSKLAIAMLKRQFDLVSSTINVQSSFLDTLRASITNQNKIKIDLAHKISQLDPTIRIDTLIPTDLLHDNLNNHNISNNNNMMLMSSTTLSSSKNNNNNNSNYSMPLGATAANSTALLMANEMQSLKHVHSFLHKRKKSQMAPFVSNHSNSSQLHRGSHSIHSSDALDQSSSPNATSSNTQHSYSTHNNTHHNNNAIDGHSAVSGGINQLENEEYTFLRANTHDHDHSPPSSNYLFKDPHDHSHHSDDIHTTEFNPHDTDDMELFDFLMAEEISPSGPSVVSTGAAEHMGGNC